MFRSKKQRFLEEKIQVLEHESRSLRARIHELKKEQADNEHYTRSLERKLRELRAELDVERSKALRDDKHD